MPCIPDTLCRCLRIELRTNSEGELKCHVSHGLLVTVKHVRGLIKYSPAKRKSSLWSHELQHYVYRLYCGFYFQGSIGIVPERWSKWLRSRASPYISHKRWWTECVERNLLFMNWEILPYWIILVAYSKAINVVFTNWLFLASQQPHDLPLTRFSSRTPLLEMPSSQFLCKFYHNPGQKSSHSTKTASRCASSGWVQAWE